MTPQEDRLVRERLQEQMEKWRSTLLTPISIDDLLDELGIKHDVSRGTKA